CEGCIDTASTCKFLCRFKRHGWGRDVRGSRCALLKLFPKGDIRHGEKNGNGDDTKHLCPGKSSLTLHSLLLPGRARMAPAEANKKEGSRSSPQVCCGFSRVRTARVRRTQADEVPVRAPCQ